MQASFLVLFWCGRRELNPHGLLHRGLRPTRLPVSPHRRILGPASTMRRRDALLAPYGERFSELQRVACARIVDWRDAQELFKRPFPSWCRRRESNPHALRRQILNLVRLPVSPHRHISDQNESHFRSGPTAWSSAHSFGSLPGPHSPRKPSRQCPGERLPPVSTEDC